MEMYLRTLEHHEDSRIKERKRMQNVKRPDSVSRNRKTLRDQEYELSSPDALVSEVPTPATGKLILTPRPSTLTIPMDEYVQYLDSIGVEHIIVLQEASVFSIALVEDYENAGFDVTHFPIEDYSVPEYLHSFSNLLEVMSNSLFSGRKVAMHCHSGRGRSGLVAACFLVENGLEADEAIEQVRDARPGAIETRPQERFIFEWAEKWESFRG